MKAKEVRIGNILKKDGVVVTIDGRSIFDMWCAKFYAENYDPIPLTPEWLRRFGFEYEKQTVGGWERWENKRIKLLDKKFSWGIGEYSPYIQYVHQLQNLYFCLCGEELQLTAQQQPNDTTPDG